MGVSKTANMVLFRHVNYLGKIFPLCMSKVVGVLRVLSFKLLDFQIKRVDFTKCYSGKRYGGY